MFIDLYLVNRHQPKFAKSPSKKSTNPSEVIHKVWNSKTTFENPPICPAKYSIVHGEICGGWNHNILLN